MLLIKYRQDPTLATMKAISHNKVVVPSISGILESKLAATQKIIQEEIIEKIKERREVQDVFSSSIVGTKRRERSYERVEDYIKDSMTESRRRLKVFEEQTDKIRVIA